MSAYELPMEVQVGDTIYKITNNGDYRMVIDCFSALGDAELSLQERLMSCIIIFYEDFNDVGDVLLCEDLQELIRQMYVFFNCGYVQKEQETKSSTGPGKLIDWDQDAQLICSAVNKVAGEEIRLKPYLHWWTFMGYYMAVDHSLLNIVATIRSKILRGQNLEKQERQFRNENPHYFVWNHKTVEQQEAEQWVHEIWNSGKEVEDATS